MDGNPIVEMMSASEIRCFQMLVAPKRKEAVGARHDEAEREGEWRRLFGGLVGRCSL